MATDYYVDSNKADDGGDGLAWGTAKKHISAALALCSDPITDNVTIHLKGTPTSPQNYIDATDQKIELIGLNFNAGEDVSLTFQVENWNDSYYEDNQDPYNDGGSWDPTATKPCVVPPFKLERTQNVIFNGLDFRCSDDEEDIIAQLTLYSSAAFHYCAFSQGTLGLLVNYFSNAEVNNCYAYDNDMGVASIYRSQVSFAGENYLKDNMRVGVGAMQSSTVVFKVWRTDTRKYITDIRTTKEILKYSAIRLTTNSSVDIEDSMFVDDDIDIAHVRIINETSFESVQYFGVVVESQSIFSGAENTSFSDANIRDGKVTIPSDRQIVVNGDEGAVTVS